MAPRYYRDPFVRYAPATHIVAKGAAYCAGVSFYEVVYMRDVLYSDGRQAREVVSRRPLRPNEFPVRLRNWQGEADD